MYWKYVLCVQFLLFLDITGYRHILVICRTII